MKKAYDQNSSMDFEIGSSATQKSSTKYARNQWSGHSNDGRLVQMDQQPNRRGNDGSCGHAGYADSGRKPPMTAAASKNSNPDAQRYGSQHRGGGTTMPTRGRETFNMGRGPTKGNAQ